MTESPQPFDGHNAAKFVKNKRSPLVVYKVETGLSCKIACIFAKPLGGLPPRGFALTTASLRVVCIHDNRSQPSRFFQICTIRQERYLCDNLNSWEAVENASCSGHGVKVPHKTGLINILFLFANSRTKSFTTRRQRLQQLQPLAPAAPGRPG